MKCDACSAALDAKDVDEARGLARCSFCGTLMDVARRTVPSGIERPEVPLPTRFNVRKEGSGLVLSWRWFTPSALFLGFFALIWNGFLVFFFAMAAKGGAPPAFFLFPIIHVAVGVGIGYMALALFVNTTTVTCGKGSLVIRHGPLPWRGNRTLARADLEQLFCTEKVNRGKNGVTVTYDVNAVLRGNRRLALVKGLEQDQALYVEQALERNLGLQDRPVGGEIPR